MSKLMRQLIIEVALGLLDEVGLDAVTTRLVSHRLGVSSAPTSSYGTGWQASINHEAAFEGGLALLIAGME